MELLKIDKVEKYYGKEGNITKAVDGISHSGNLGTIALRKYSPYTVTTYTFMFAAIGSWIICDPPDMFFKFSNTSEIGFLIVLCGLTALITAVIPFLAYTLGLESVEASKAGIIATIEPMVATLVGIVVQ